MQLEIKNITKQYKNKKALDNVSVILEPGIYGFLGPNGAGKSTLMNIMAGVVKATKGSIMLDGKDVVAMGEKYREMLGFLPQTGGFYKNFTGEEFLTYMAILKGMKGKESIEAKNKELLKKTNLAKVGNVKIGSYSGGMRQRLGIAQALINDPKILIMDEPTVGLDPKERIRFRNLLSELSKDTIVILATHIVSDVSSIAGKVIFIKEGKIIETGETDKCIEKIRGKIYEKDMDDREAGKIIDTYKIVNILKNGNMMKVRYISEKAEDGIQVEPTLEDLYMYYFGEEGLC